MARRWLEAIDTPQIATCLSNPALAISERPVSPHFRRFPKAFAAVKYLWSIALRMLGDSMGSGLPGPVASATGQGRLFALLTSSDGREEAVLRGLYRFDCRFETDAVLPAFKGSVLRGAFGRALRQSVCTAPKAPCIKCPENKTCLYPAVFDRSAVQRPSYDRRSPPAPYVLQPPDSVQRSFSAGETFEFGLLLFGEANRSLAYLIYALERAGAAGIGAEGGGARGRFRIESVCGAGQTVFSGGNKRFDPAPLSATPELHADANGCRQMTVILKTPLRLKQANHLNDRLPFHVLMSAALRRIADLHNHFGSGEPDLDYAGLVRKARSVETAQDHLRWSERKRYSGRQKTEMLFGGLVGEVVYAGDLGPFLPVLAYGAELHLGKQTTFGLGKVAVFASV